MQVYFSVEPTDMFCHRQAYLRYCKYCKRSQCKTEMTTELNYPDSNDHDGPKYGTYVVHWKNISKCSLREDFTASFTMHTMIWFSLIKCMQ